MRVLSRARSCCTRPSSSRHSKLQLASLLVLLLLLLLLVAAFISLSNVNLPHPGALNDVHDVHDDPLRPKELQQLPTSPSSTRGLHEELKSNTSAAYYNVWCVFTKVTSNSPMRSKFRVLVDSLLRHSSKSSLDSLVFHVFVDEHSRLIAERVVEYVCLVNRKTLKVQYYNVQKSSAKIEDIVAVMSPFFSSKPGTYYSDALFYLSLGLHRIAPENQDLAVMLDADTKFRVDIRELFAEFKNFTKEALFGLGPELTPVYRHVLHIYRNRNPKTHFGEPAYLGGYPGYNSGVVLLNLKRLRESLEYDQIIGRDSVEHMVDKYHFKGHLGDQDFYTLLGMERPEFIHSIDCGWNRQLCTWWRDRGYADVFANYSLCKSKTKLWHGNCNTPIPNS